MKIDFEQEFETIHGKPLQQSRLDGDDPVDCDTCGAPNLLLQPLTLREVCLNAVLDNDKGMDGKTKAKRYDLALRIQRAEEPITLKDGERNTIKKLLAKIYPPLIVGQAWPMLDDKEEDE